MLGELGAKASYIMCQNEDPFEDQRQAPKAVHARAAAASFWQGSCNATVLREIGKLLRHAERTYKSDCSPTAGPLNELIRPTYSDANGHSIVQTNFSD